MKKRKRPAFTLVEIAITISILMVLTSMLVPAAKKIGAVFDGYTQIVIISDIYTVKEAKDLFARLYGRQPESFDDIKTAE